MFQRIELALQGFLREQRVNVVMARTAKPRESVFDFVTVKVSPDPLVPMTGLGDEMMLRQQADLSSTKFTNTIGAHARYVSSLSGRR